jgi:hypothetical protein
VLGVLVQWFYGGVVVLVCWFVVERFVMMWRYWFDEFVGLLWCGAWMCLCVGLWWCGGVGLLVCGGVVYGCISVSCCGGVVVWCCWFVGLWWGGVEGMSNTLDR